MKAKKSLVLIKPRIEDFNERGRERIKDFNQTYQSLLDKPIIFRQSDLAYLYTTPSALTIRDENLHLIWKISFGDHIYVQEPYCT